MRTKSMIFLALVAVATMVACGPGEEAEAPSAETEAPSPAAEAPVATGSISGVISYTNGDPDAEIGMDADPVCSELHAEPVYTQQIVSEGGGLGNVFIYIKEGAPAGSAPAEPHVLNQEGCQYHPHVSGVMVGQKLLIRNSDPTLHNIHALPEKNQEFNQGQPFEGMELEKTFDQPEVMIRFKCDVHPWMSAYMGVLEHPYFTVSLDDGAFTIESVPAGDYVLEAWHETLGTQIQEITVGEGPTEVLFEFAG